MNPSPPTAAAADSLAPDPAAEIAGAPRHADGEANDNAAAIAALLSAHPSLRKLRTLPPLSPFTYYRRNIARTLPVGGAIAISVFLIASIVTLLNSVDASIARNYGFVRRFSVLATQLETRVAPPLRRAAQQSPAVGQTVTAVPYVLPIRTVFGTMPVPVYGLDRAAMVTIVRATGNHLAAGRWPRPNQAEIVLSRQWANNYEAHLGSTIGRRRSKFRLAALSQKLVGILEGGENIALCDRTFFELTLPAGAVRDNYLLLPRAPGQLGAMNLALNDLLDRPAQHHLAAADVRYARLYTFKGLVGELRKDLGFLYTFLAVADVLVIGAVALMGAFLANIYFEGRLGEFGLLAAFGFARERLARRVIAETAILVCAGWTSGMALSWLLFRAVDHFYMRPRGLVLAPLDSLAVCYTLPTPFIVGVASLATVLLRLYRLDPIDIMERR